MARGYILTPKEREFIEDWLKVVEGKMEKVEFFRKWGTKKDNSGVLEDYVKVREGEMTLEEFREKWTKKGSWKNYVTVMKHRLRVKHRNLRAIYKQIKEEVSLLNAFFSLKEMP